MATIRWYLVYLGIVMGALLLANVNPIFAQAVNNCGNLTPGCVRVPEPSTFVLMGTALVGAVAVARMRLGRKG
ncbi:MAG TPA: PEP-CTERM sorting domain-containing protein [bacterium]|nr:PEP-CTERM sorting domain-containing protein [bacterium]